MTAEVCPSRVIETSGRGVLCVEEARLESPSINRQGHVL